MQWDRCYGKGKWDKAKSAAQWLRVSRPLPWIDDSRSRRPAEISCRPLRRSAVGWPATAVRLQEKHGLASTATRPCQARCPCWRPGCVEGAHGQGTERRYSFFGVSCCSLDSDSTPGAPG